MDLDYLVSLVAKGERLSEVRRLLTDTEIRDHLKNLPWSEIEVSRLVLEKTLCPAEVDFQFEIDTCYENREGRVKRLMSPTIP
jgi:hypothetical protein